MTRIKVGVVFGGRSGEHEISVMSARSVLQNLDPERYEAVPIYVSRDGMWLGPSLARRQLEQDVRSLTTTGFSSAEALSWKPGGSGHRGSLSGSAEVEGIDLIFPVIHGTFGEDGTLQGLLEMVDIPYVGAGVLASSLGMDKSLMKAVCQEGGLPVLPASTLLRSEWESSSGTATRDSLLESIEKVAGYPAFVKPCNLGSSVGISKVWNREQLVAGIETAVSFDRKILIEKGLNSPREIELAVLGNDYAQVSVPGEIIHQGEFYDYQTKYFETEGQKIQIPAVLEPKVAEALQALALQTYRTLDLNGLSRVDFLLDVAGDGALYLNEVNTMPGFTPISMYSMLWRESGKAYAEVLDDLIALAFERFEDRTRNQTQ